MPKVHCHQKLTLESVVSLALENADAYRVVGLDFVSAALEEQATIGAALDPTLVGAMDYQDDNSAKTNGFQPLRSKDYRWNLGVQKNWDTGTLTSLTWSQDRVDSQFADLGAMGDVFVTNYKQSAAVLALEQSLLKNRCSRNC